MASILAIINRLLPFATPGTPLVQDLLHLAAICGALYFAPQIQEYINTRRRQDDAQVPQDAGLVEDQDHERAPTDQILENEEQTNEPEAANLQNDVRPAAHEEEDAHDHEDHPEPGPANGPDTPSHQRNVGAKKAKSLAKRDQRRAYHEFMRSQGDAQREREAADAAEREAVLEVERQRRRATEAALEAKKAKEREAKREQERKGREEEIRRREMAVDIVREDLERSRMCDLFKVANMVGDDVDEEWVEKILKATGMLGKRDGVMTMITGMGWIVRVSEEDMARVYQSAAEHGSADEGLVTFDELGSMLEATLRTHAVK